MRRITVRELVIGGAIAAIYAVLTIAIAPISSGLMQCRLSEALCILPWFTPAAVPGLFLGCLIANLLTGAVVYDVVFGSLATLLAALCTRWVSLHANNGGVKYLAPLPPVIANGLIIGWLLTEVYQVGVSFAIAALYVAAGEALACYGLGIPLLLILEKNGNRLFPGR